MKRALCLAILMSGVLGHRNPVTADAGQAVCGMASDAVLPTEADAQWDVLETCIEDPPVESDHEFAEVWPKRSKCGEAARTVARAGNDADLERLWSLFDALPEDSPMVEDILNALLDRHVERALAALEATSKPAAIDSVAGGEMPAFLQNGPDELQQAWHVYQSVAAAQEKEFDRPSAESVIAFQSNQPAFRRTVAAFLRGRMSPAEAVAEASRYEWGGWCGTGSDMLYAPKAKAMLIAYLQLGRLDLALTAGGVLTGRFMGMEGPAIGSDPRLLAAAGIDWERYLLGGVLSGRFDLAIPLVVQGSAKAARGLFTAGRALDAAGDEAPEDVSEGLLFPLAALVEPDESRTCPAWDSREVGRRAADAEPIPADVQVGVLDLLARRVGPAAGRREAEAASHLLVNLGRTESRETFGAMLGSRYDEVRKNGAIGLRGLGEIAEDPQPSRPVMFRLVVDGKPAADRAVWWRLDKADGGAEMNEVHADGAGLVPLDHDRFVDPRDRVSSVNLRSPELKTAADEWFDVAAAPPTDLDVVTTVSVSTGVLTVIIPPALFDGPQPSLAALVAIPDHDDGDGEALDLRATAISADLPVVSTRVTFPHLQHGRYQVWLRHGREAHRSPVVEVGADPAMTTIGLEAEPAYSSDGEDPEDRAASPTNQPL